MQLIRYFDLMKAFDYIDRYVKSNSYFSEKTYFHACAACPEIPYNISTMGLPVVSNEMGDLFRLIGRNVLCYRSKSDKNSSNMGI